MQIPAQKAAETAVFVFQSYLAGSKVMVQDPSASTLTRWRPGCIGQHLVASAVDNTSTKAVSGVMRLSLL